ncbi:MAG: hypothetical protein ABW051_01670, partial [Burkholderiaceae bacterium]
LGSGRKGATATFWSMPGETCITCVCTIGEVSAQASGASSRVSAARKIAVIDLHDGVGLHRG